MRSIYTTLTISLALIAVVVGCNESAPPANTSNDADQSASVTTTAVNDYCPMMGGKITDEGGTVEWEGKTIGFCCPGCDEKFEALSDDEKAEKLAAAQAKSEGDADHNDPQHGDHEHS